MNKWNTSLNTEEASEEIIACQFKALVLKCWITAVSESAREKASSATNGRYSQAFTLQITFIIFRRDIHVVINNQ